MPKLYSAFQDKKSIKNALSIFAVIAFEQVVTKYGINCRNALLWLCIPPCVIFGITLIKSIKSMRALYNSYFIISVVAFEQVVTKYGINCRNALQWLCIPPCVIFGITLIKSKNVRLLFNRKTSKKRCLDPQMIGEGVAAFLYMMMPSVAWVIAAFLNSKIWICYRAGYDECGVVRSCTKQEEYDFHITERDAKSEAQTLGLWLLTGSVIALGIITWGNHLLFARPVKEIELNEIVREAARSELERFVMSRAKDRLSQVGKEPEPKSTDNGNTNTEDPVKEKDETADQKTADKDSKSQSEASPRSVWLKTVDYKIDVFLDEFLSLDNVKMVYPEV